MWDTAPLISNLIDKIRKIAKAFRRKPRLRLLLNEAQLKRLHGQTNSRRVSVDHGENDSEVQIIDETQARPQISLEESEEILETGNVFELGTQHVREAIDPDVEELFQTHVRSRNRSVPIRDDREFIKNIQELAPDQSTEPLVMLIDQATRWNSKFLMLERYLQVHPAIQDVFNGRDPRNPLDRRDFEGLEELSFEERHSVLWIWRILYTAYVITLQAQLEDALYPTILKNIDLYQQRLGGLSLFEGLLSPFLQQVRAVAYLIS